MKEHADDICIVDAGYSITWDNTQIHVHTHH